tara:strand:+ start:835 stop:1470 length:636 start_codon:yes stop_codon:yes gene_type:complete
MSEKKDHIFYESISKDNSNKDLDFEEFTFDEKVIEEEKEELKVILEIDRKYNKVSIHADALNKMGKHNYLHNKVKNDYYGNLIEEKEEVKGYINCDISSSLIEFEDQENKKGKKLSNKIAIFIREDGDFKMKTNYKQDSNFAFVITNKKAVQKFTVNWGSTNKQNKRITKKKWNEKSLLETGSNGCVFELVGNCENVRTNVRKKNEKKEKS